MKIKTGPLLVIGALVVLVGMTLLLSPAPPPASTAGHEEEEAAKEGEAKKQEKKPEAPEITLADIKTAVASDENHAVSKAMEDLQKAAVTTRDAVKKAAFVQYAQELAVKDKREQIRAQALNILMSAPDVDAKVLVSAAERDSSPAVRQAALLAMSRFPAGGEVEAVLRKYSSNSDPGLRSAAVISLTQMLTASGQAGNEQLALLLGEADNDAGAKAAISLQNMGPKVLPTLTKTLYTSKNGRQRQGAAMCIALVCAGYSPILEEFAKQAQVTHRQEPEHRKANLAGLAPLTWALKNDTWPATREIAAQGLGYLGDERAAVPLAAALKDPDALVRRRAAAALITIPAKSVVAQLSQSATGDSVAEVRRFAVEALGWTGTAAAAAKDDATRTAIVPALNQATKDESPVVRRYAAVQLGRIADPASLESLSALLSGQGDPDADVRWAAVIALGKLRDKRAEHVLVQCLSDPSPQVSNSAERALQKMGVARHEKAGFES